MRRLILGVALGMSIVSAFGQNAVQRAVSAMDPEELSGPPKKLTIVTPVVKGFAQSPALEALSSKDPKKLADAVRDMATFINQEPTNSDFYFLRAALSCLINGNKQTMLDDATKSIKLHTPGKEWIYDSLRDHYGFKAKIEFDSGRYQDAMNDLDAAILVDPSGAGQIFNDGNVKPNQPNDNPCAWKQSDLTTLARAYPKDYRPPMYMGLYLMYFATYSLDSDYAPILKYFENAAELNSKSALPLYFAGDLHIMGGIGGFMSMANAVCLDDEVPRTEQCLELDEIHRKGVRYLTRAILADPKFAPAYELRAEAYLKLKGNRQAIRDFTKALELDPSANVYNDRANAEMGLGQYQAAIQDYTKRIAKGCNDSLCPTYENRANAYLKLKDYQHAISDISHAIRNFLDGTIFGFNIEQFRRIYPEYDDVADDVLCEKLRALFLPNMTYETYSKQFLAEAKEVDDFVLPNLFLKRGDAYADSGNIVRANREYDRVSHGFPKWAQYQFKIEGSKRIRIRE